VSTTFDQVPQDLVGAAEMVKMFGVSRQYVDRLTKFEGFPEPEATLVSGRVWLRSAIEEWARAMGREVH
jgi:predicted DNA-binding transcriptional regulator AlpA